MSISKLTENLNNISSLPDKPNLQSDELKAVFDESGNTIKEYINTILTKEIDDMESQLNKTIQNISKIVETNKKEVFNQIYPVGSIYMSVSNANPSTLFGGTWKLWGAGKVPVCVDTSQAEFNTAEKIGGNKTHNHTTGNFSLGVNHIPSHTHAIGSSGGHTHSITVKYTSDATSTGSSARPNGVGNNSTTSIATIANNTGTHTHTPANTGGGQAHNHGNTGNTSLLQPYITCYMWKRTS